jgi:hypothetical protein
MLRRIPSPNGIFVSLSIRPDALTTGATPGAQKLWFSGVDGGVPGSTLKASYRMITTI